VGNGSDLFEWIQVAAAQDYLLSVGTAPYAANLLNSGVLPPTTFRSVASDAPKATTRQNAAAARAADASSPKMSPSSPTIALPASAAWRRHTDMMLSPTTWLMRLRTVHSSHGVGFRGW